MLTISELEKRFGVPGRFECVAGQGGLPMVKVHTDKSAAEIYLHGAHVTRFQKRNEEPLLWMSKESRFDEQSPIRGGVPIILPWFGPRDGAAAHGVARVRSWELQDMAFADDGTKLHFHLPDCADVPGFAPFTADYTVTVGDVLHLELAVTNLSTDRDLVFEDCLHTYFTIGEVGAVSVHGLKGAKYLDKVGGLTERMETSDSIRIPSEVDRVYLNTTAAVEIHDEKLRRKIRIEKSGSASTVVWNPWIAKSKAMPDFGDDEYHHMICVESGNVAENKIILAAGKTSVMKVSLSSAGY